MGNIYFLLLSIIVFSAIFFTIYIIISLIITNLNNVKVIKIILFYGKPIFSFNYKNYPVQIGWIPIGSSLDLEENLRKKNPLFKLLLLKTIPFIVFFILLLIIDGFNVYNVFISGVNQFYLGALSPFNTAQTYLSNYSQLLFKDGILVSLIFWLTKLISFSAYSLFIIIVSEVILKFSDYKFENEKLPGVYLLFQGVSYFTVFFMCLSWILAIIKYCFTFF